MLKREKTEKAKHVNPEDLISIATYKPDKLSQQSSILYMTVSVIRETSVCIYNSLYSSAAGAD